MKMSVRTTFLSGRPRASAFTCGRDFTRGHGKNRIRTDAVVRPRGRGSTWARDRASARTRVDTRRAATGPRGRAAMEGGEKK
jgi:hypothetical protein